MRREATTERKATVGTLTVIAKQMFAEQPVWQTTAFDTEIARRWTERTKETPDNYGRLKSGRNQFLNLVDWVKANFTRSEITITFDFAGREYRILVNAVGKVHGETLVSLEHMFQVLKAIANQLSKQSNALNSTHTERNDQ